MKRLLVDPEPQEALPWSFDAPTPGRHRALELAQRVASSSCPLLILGPTGVGKEVLAEDIHRHSARAAGPFVSVNCAAVVPSLFENEFFGHVKGAFTGAVSNKVGLIELADGGVLFLDEVGDLSAEGQAKLLRFLAKGTYWPVGATHERRANVRVIAATHREIDGAPGGSFREDLFYRLSVVVIRIPALEPGDIHAIARTITVDSMVRYGVAVLPAHVEMLAELCGTREWRGGVRELRNIIERFLVLYDRALSIEENWAELFGAGDAGTQSGVRLRTPDASMAKHLDNLIFLGIAHECSDVRELAQRTGRTTQAIYGRLRKLGLRSEDLGPTPALLAALRQVQRQVQPHALWVQSLLTR